MMDAQSSGASGNGAPGTHVAPRSAATNDEAELKLLAPAGILDQLRL
jgi:hypothetical protein